MTAKHARRPFLLALLFGAVVGLSTGGCGDPPSDDADAPANDTPAPVVDAGPTKIRFTDVTKLCGITSRNHSGREGVKEFLIEAVGPGPAWLDFNNDGLLDVFIPDGDVFSNYELHLVGDPQRPILIAKENRAEAFHDHLWRNNGDGTFDNVTEAAGIVDEDWSFGATAYDFDADGDTDIYVSNYGKNRMWRNEGNGRFVDVAESLGVQGDPGTWSTCAGVGDLDGDDRLDLFVAAYADPAFEVNRQREERGLPLGTPVEAISGRSCLWRSVRAYCGPLGLAGQHDTAFRQLEDGTYEDVTDRWRMRPRVPQYGFTVLIFDFNEDGLPDVFVANDSVENHMWQQERDPKGRAVFRETSDYLGIKYGQKLDPQASMGMFVGDINLDGFFDIFITNFSHDYNNIHFGRRVGGEGGTHYFKDRGLQIMGQPVFYDLSWGCGWYDFENDRDLDLYYANGHVYKEIDLQEKAGVSYQQLNALFECIDARKNVYREIGAKAEKNPPKGVDPKDLWAGDGMHVMECSRAAAFADFNNDGLMDVLIGNLNGVSTMLLNTSEVGPDNNWVKIVLEQEGMNREALGAVIEVTAGGLTQRFPVLRQTSFLGTDDPRLHVGLGAERTCDVRVIWPGQARERTEYTGLKAGTMWKLHRTGAKAEEVKLKRFDVR